MRISTTQIFQNGISSMQTAQVRLSKLNEQISSGERLLTASDDPSSATRTVELESMISNTEQFQRNADTVLAQLELEESTLDSYEDYLQQIRELVVQGATGTQSNETRSYIATEIRSLYEGVFDLSNTLDANDEYLFSGTSADQPFVADVDGKVSYVGAEGIHAVREVEIGTILTMPVGNTGAEVFMDIPEESGLILEGVQPFSNTGTLVVEDVRIIDDEEFAENPEQTYTIQFTDNAGTIEYEVIDGDGNTVLDADGNPIQNATYVAGNQIYFEGRSLTLSGTAADGDSVTVRPAEYVSVFDTIDSIASAFESGVTTTEDQENLRKAIDIALQNLDSTLEQMNLVRTSVGARINTLDTQVNANEERLLTLETNVSSVRDLDYAQAISEFKQQEVVLEAAQQAYVQVTRLSLFDFL